jgi:hypothetical protein
MRNFSRCAGAGRSFLFNLEVGCEASGSGVGGMGLWLLELIWRMSMSRMGI